jgi:hypothetical protein
MHVLLLPKAPQTSNQAAAWFYFWSVYRDLKKLSCLLKAAVVCLKFRIPRSIAGERTDDCMAKDIPSSKNCHDFGLFSCLRVRD